jgi:hypothetical protein
MLTAQLKMSAFRRLDNSLNGSTPDPERLWKGNTQNRLDGGQSG